MSLIYEPKGRAREYSPLAVNLYRGCDHRCSYCYAPRVLRADRQDYATVTPRISGPGSLDREAAKLDGKKQVLMSFTGDPYCIAEEEYRLTRMALEVFHARYIPVAILTKGGSRCLRDLVRFKLFGDHIKVGATLTTPSDAISREVEPGAAVSSDRIDALDELRRAGVRTWVSLEPVLSADDSLAVITSSLGVADEYRLGKISGDPARERAIDWPRYLETAVSILRGAGKPFYVKQDLREAAPGVKLAPEETDMDARLAAPWGLA